MWRAEIGHTLSTDSAIILGATSNTLNDEELVMSNPHLKKLFNKMLDEHIKRAEKEGESSNSRILTTLTPTKANEQTARKTSGKFKEAIKSPSDTTIYVQALKRTPVQPNTTSPGQNIPICQAVEKDGSVNVVNSNQRGISSSRACEDPEIMRKISDFVDQLRINHEMSSQTQSPEQNQHLKSTVNAPGFDEAQRRTDRAIIEAEKFKASVEAPAGTNFQINESLNDNLLNLQGEVSSVHQQIGLGLTDDDFFHLTCHIDPNLQLKIEKGSYVDLDKLLPNEKGSDQQYSNETKLEWVQSEGSTYLVPAKKMSRVNCFRCWEQAFRMYATIYCSKNPNRSREIWQYISVINTTSLAYSWDNVYNYDIIFRQLMEFNPSCSWAVTYNQMWNLSMTNPLGAGMSNIKKPQGSYNFSGTSQNKQQQEQTSFKRKTDYCWSFNKGNKCKFGKRCKFIERCSYCDSPYHGLVKCEKLDKRDKESAMSGMNKKGKFSK